MTYVITDACIDVKDKSCIEVCPVDCIYVEPEDQMCYVHPTQCIDCAACESACPVGAIFIESEVPKASIEFTALNVQWFEDKDSVRSRIKELSSGGLSIT